MPRPRVTVPRTVLTRDDITHNRHHAHTPRPSCRLCRTYGTAALFATR